MTAIRNDDVRPFRVAVTDGETLHRNSGIVDAANLREKRPYLGNAALSVYHTSSMTSPPDVSISNASPVDEGGSLSYTVTAHVGSV